MSEITAGLTPIESGQLTTVTVEELRRMSIPELVQFAHMHGVDVQRVQAERGKLLTEIMNIAFDA